MVQPPYLCEMLLCCYIRDEEFAPALETHPRWQPRCTKVSPVTAESARPRDAAVGAHMWPGKEPELRRAHMSPGTASLLLAACMCGGPAREETRRGTHQGLTRMGLVPLLPSVRGCT